MNNKKIGLLFLDAEFTGLPHATRPPDMWEVGWLLDIDGQIIDQQNFYLRHDNDRITSWVLKNTLYKKIFLSDNNNQEYTLMHLSKVSDILIDVLSKYTEESDIYAVGSQIHADLEHLFWENQDLRKYIHWRNIDIAQMFFGYTLAKGDTEIKSPVNVPKMLKYFNLKTSGKRHTVNTDNADLRNIYYKMLGENNVNRTTS